MMIMFNGNDGSTPSAPRVFGPLALYRLVALALCGVSLSAMAQDRADIDRTQIIGNRELPKVLYIVPWKKPLPGDLVGRPQVSVVDEALAPLDRDVFRREVRFEAQTRAKPAVGAAPTNLATTTAPAAPPAPAVTPATTATTAAAAAPAKPAP